jgi:hypothetical protein
VKLIESMEQLQSWEEYRDVLHLYLKALAESGEPFFISKNKVDFDLDGKPWKGHAVLTGSKGQMCVQKLQQKGVIFRTGTCGKSGKELKVNGLEGKLLKEAARTLKKLRLGFQIAGVEAEEDGQPEKSPDEAGAASTASTDGAGAKAAAGAPEARSTVELGKQADRIAKAVDIWVKTEAAAKQEVRKLQKALLGIEDPRAKPVIQGLENILARIDKVDDEAKAVAAAAGSGDQDAFNKARADFVKKLDGILAHVEQDELIRQADANPVFEVKIRETFSKSLNQLLKAI